MGRFVRGGGPIKKPYLVQVSWIDSEAWAGVWDSVEAVRAAYREDGFDAVHTVGYMLELRTDGVLLCMSLHHDKGHTTASRGALFYSIPWGCIKTIKRLH